MTLAKVHAAFIVNIKDVTNSVVCKVIIIFWFLKSIKSFMVICFCFGSARLFF